MTQFPKLLVIFECTQFNPHRIPARGYLIYMNNICIYTYTYRYVGRGLSWQFQHLFQKVAKNIHSHPFSSFSGVHNVDGPFIARRPPGSQDGNSLPKGKAAPEGKAVRRSRCGHRQRNHYEGQCMRTPSCAVVMF